MNQTRKNEILGNIINMLDRQECYPEIYERVSEPGYNNRPLLVANWNPLKGSGLTEYIENTLNVETHWNDEFTACSVCGGAVKTTPDCYGWQASYVWLNDCEIACIECWKDNIDSIIEYYSNSYKRAVPYDMIELLVNEGFTCYQDKEYCKIFENGWYPGQNDNPETIAKEIKKALPNCEFIFALQAVGQFDIHFTVLIRQ